MKKAGKIPNIHPGEVLLEDFLKPLEISQYRLAKDIGVMQSTISDVVNGKRGVTADLAMRLGQYFQTTAKLWLNLQEMYDLEETKRTKGYLIIRIKPFADRFTTRRVRMVASGDLARTRRDLVPSE